MRRTIKRALMFGFTRHLIGAWFVMAGFRLFDLRGA